MIYFIAVILAAIAVPLLAERKLYPETSLATAFQKQARSTVDDIVGVWTAAIAGAKVSLAFVGVAFLIWLLYSVLSRLF